MVDEHAAEAGLVASGWALSHGETYCPACASARGLEHDAEAAAAPQEGEPQLFPGSAVSGESRVGRALRLMGASFRVLREDPGLAVFPLVSLVLSAIVGIVCFGNWAPHSHAAGSSRSALLVPSLIAAYPLSFISVYCSVALAAVLGNRLDGKPMTIGQGFSAANERIGLIAAWALLVCTVGALLRLLEERLPLAGRIAAGMFGLAWSLATLFAVPVLAYEGLGPLKTVERSTQIFKRRWGAQIGGTAGIGLIGAIIAIPFALILLVGASRPQGGTALVVLGGAGTLAAIAFTGALEQIYRVFVYRSAVGLDTAGAPFSEHDLRRPLARGR
jgi:uncharacterized protein DUF6159